MIVKRRIELGRRIKLPSGDDGNITLAGAIRLGLLAAVGTAAKKFGLAVLAFACDHAYAFLIAHHLLW